MVSLLHVLPHLCNKILKKKQRSEGWKSFVVSLLSGTHYCEKNMGSEVNSMSMRPLTLSLGLILLCHGIALTSLQFKVSRRGLCFIHCCRLYVQEVNGAAVTMEPPPPGHSRPSVSEAKDEATDCCDHVVSNS